MKPWTGSVSATPGPTTDGRVDGKSRVLIVSPQPFYQDRGTPIAVSQLAAALSALGYEVDLLAFPIGSPMHIPGLRVVRGSNPFGIRDVRIGFSFRKIVLDAGLLRPLRGLLRSNRYGAVHALEEMIWPVILMCRHRNFPVIYDMQSSLPDQLRTHGIFRVRWVQGMLRRLEDWAIRSSSAVICAAGLLKHVKARSPRTVAFEWKWPGQELDPGARPDQMRARLGIGGDRRIVMYAGTFEPYQGIGMFLDAMLEVSSAVPQAIAVLVGSTPGADLATDPRVSRLAAEGRLLVLPRQPRQSIPAYLQMADVLVSPRAYGDNVPLKIFDYVQAGRPIVATDIAAHRSVLDGSTAVLVDCSPAGLAAGIGELLANPNRGAAIAAAARHQASVAPGKQAYIDLVESLYATTLEPALHPPRARRRHAR